MTVYSEWNEAEAAKLAADFEGVPGALLPALHAIQARFGFISEKAIRVVAETLNLSRADVYGVVSFYHDFRREMPGRHVIRLCQAEACQAMGSRSLTNEVKRTLGVDFHQSTDDGVFSLEPVYCLGNCACSPALMIDDQVFGRVSSESFQALVEEYREAAGK